jgi:hypothetical protein
MSGGSRNIAPMVPATIPPAVASAMAPNKLSAPVPTASGIRLARVVRASNGWGNFASGVESARDAGCWAESGTQAASATWLL